MADLNDRVAAAVRRERGSVLGGLIRWCGSVEDAEEAFQEASLAALRAWREEVPANPGAWLMTTAKNRVRDASRRRARADAKASFLADGEARDPVGEAVDDHLRLLFLCCHPDLPLESRVALTLQVAMGFSSADVGRALLSGEEAVARRVQRAKQVVARAPLPAPEVEVTSPPRVEAVLGVIYALFNEGYLARTGDLMRIDLQASALGLARRVCDLIPGEAEAFGLLALIALSAARAGARVDPGGLPVLLPEQDRGAWSGALTEEGLMALARAQRLGGDGAYTLQAEIVALHMSAPPGADPDWAAIVTRYDALAEVTGQAPVVRLNRAIALAMRDGPLRGLAELAELEGPLGAYSAFFATRAALLERAGEDPVADLTEAIRLATNDATRRLLERRLAQRG